MLVSLQQPTVEESGTLQRSSVSLRLLIRRWFASEHVEFFVYLSAFEGHRLHYLFQFYLWQMGLRRPACSKVRTLALIDLIWDNPPHVHMCYSLISYNTCIVIIVRTPSYSHPCCLVATCIACTCMGSLSHILRSELAKQTETMLALDRFCMFYFVPGLW